MLIERNITIGYSGGPADVAHLVTFLAPPTAYGIMGVSIAMTEACTTWRIDASQRTLLLNWLRRDRKEAPAASLGALHIVKPWARSSATSPWTGGGYMTIVNEGPPDRLRSAHSEAAGWIDIHGIRVVGSDLAMRPLESPLAVPTGTTVLKPRGYHILLVGLAAPLVAGTRLPMTLHFETAGALDVDLEVQAPGIVGGRALLAENNGAD